MNKTTGSHLTGRSSRRHISAGSVHRQPGDYYSPQPVTIKAFHETFERRLKEFGGHPSIYNNENFYLSLHTREIWSIVEDLESSRFSRVDRARMNDVISYVQRLGGENTNLELMLLNVSLILDLEYTPTNKLSGLDLSRFAEIFRDKSFKESYEVMLIPGPFGPWGGNGWSFKIYERPRWRAHWRTYLASLEIKDNSMVLRPDNSVDRVYYESFLEKVKKIEECVSRITGHKPSEVWITGVPLDPYRRDSRKQKPWKFLHFVRFLPQD